LDGKVSALKYMPPVQPLRRVLARSDEALCALVARGDAMAFEVLYRRHHQALYRYCRSIVADDDDASDALQNAMVKAWNALSRGDAHAPPRAWLFRIAHNEAVGMLRLRRPYIALQEDQAPATASLEETVETRLRLSRLRADLEALPDRQRSALLLRELSGLAHVEIAYILDVSPATARQTIYEARLALHEAEAGRRLSCDVVRRALSDGDGRRLRARTLRGHLRDCATCSSFEHALGRRAHDLTALYPGPSRRRVGGPAHAALLEQRAGRIGDSRRRHGHADRGGGDGDPERRVGCRCDRRHRCPDGRGGRRRHRQPSRRRLCVGGERSPGGSEAPLRPSTQRHAAARGVSADRFSRPQAGGNPL
jgi:RNA polymerase sigma factor (sigma-70 family)